LVAPAAYESGELAKGVAGQIVADLVVSSAELSETVTDSEVDVAQVLKCTRQKLNRIAP